jgi:hypothetical protein
MSRDLDSLVKLQVVRRLTVQWHAGAVGVQFHEHARDLGEPGR